MISCIHAENSIYFVVLLFFYLIWLCSKKFFLEKICKKEIKKEKKKKERESQQRQRPSQTPTQLSPARGPELPRGPATRGPPNTAAAGAPPPPFSG